MFKKIKRIFVNFHEWIFKRKELLKFKTQAALLEGEVELLESIKEGQASQLRILKSGESMNLTRLEKYMILKAIQREDFKEWVENPVTKALDRIIWRGLREKIRLHIKKGDEVQEDDETKAGDNG